MNEGHLKHIDTLLAAAGLPPDADTGAVVPPLHLATTFDKRLGGIHHYTRESNPTRSALEQVLAAIEGGSLAAAFSSGMAAATSIIASLGVGAHVVYPDDVYVGLRRLLTQVAPRWGVESTSADFTDIDAVAAAIVPDTRLIWLETPSNPLLRITDLPAVIALAESRGIYTVVDNTWATPLLQRPLDLGADLVLHALTKYIAGHSDVLGGVVISRADHHPFDAVREFQTTAGAVMDPFSAWLTLRGLRTLSVRMNRACDNADQVAAFLAGHPRVARVHFPGLPGHPGREVAIKQMARGGAMLSFEPVGTQRDAEEIPRRTTVFLNATSLGGTESLIEHRASAEGSGSASPPNLIRISVGLENAQDLIDDLEQALGRK